MSAYPLVQIRPERTKNLLAGHPWIFSGALAGKPKAADGGPLADGSLVGLASGKLFLGTGYYNSRTDIAVRLLSRKEETIDAAFFAERFHALRKRKEEWLPARTNAYRIAFAEADGLPGLVVDKYNDVLVAQFHTMGMDILKPQIVEALLQAFSPATLVERSDVGVRRAEGLEPLPPGILHGPGAGETEIEEQGFRFIVDVMKGQKTGFFLDQRENRGAVTRYCRGRSVLNCFAYSGGFSVYAASTARRVSSVDISKPAIDLCRRNFQLNNLPAADEDFVARDVFEHLDAIDHGAFDCIILDPPSFAKNRGQVTNAIKAYTTLNSKALGKLPDEGILVSSSCTSHIDNSTFLKILHQSSVLAGCSLRVLEAREQPFDHPYHLSFPEGRYLKFFVMQKSRA
jgi:23S rRNA (cytosine1962-C5)-methyltransferase